MALPEQLLHAAPLLFATSSLTFTVCEDIFIRPLVELPLPGLTTAAATSSFSSGAKEGEEERKKKLRVHNNRVLPGHGRWLRGGLGIVFSMYPLSIATAVANVNIATATALPPMAVKLYTVGAVFSALHMVFGPRAMSLLASIREDKNNVRSAAETKAKRGLSSGWLWWFTETPHYYEDNTAAMEAWLWLNAVRGAVTDFTQWACYLVAFVLVSRAV
ncbi:hypothetical protein DL767_006977 [Monosporascus sp. MG133]|nr:hypothetical protein DL767_006977 [Monosporascus sp. MG133]